MEQAASHGPLTGLRVLEIGHFVAAPFCTRLLGDLGADIIKIEPPSGDPVRQWGKQLDGNALWWSIHGRNKRCITLNLKHPKATGIVLRLVAGCDALVENFRPGQLAKLGLAMRCCAVPGRISWSRTSQASARTGPTATARRSASSARRSAACGT